MRENAKEHIEILIRKYRMLEHCKDVIIEATEILITCFAQGHKLLICGNGGSAADSQHIVGELMKGFVRSRQIPKVDQDYLRANILNSEYVINNLQCALPAISLGNEIALTTAFSNDREADLIFAQQVYGLGNPGDTLLAISTSGNSKNIINAINVAKMKNMSVISLTGTNGGNMRGISDILINVPEKETYKIQELHLPVYHAICMALEEEFFSEGSK